MKASSQSLVVVQASWVFSDLFMGKVLHGFRAFSIRQTNVLPQRLKRRQPVAVKLFPTSYCHHRHSSVSRRFCKMESTDGTTQHPPLVRFYDPAISAPDFNGRTLTSILAWDDRRLEDCHNYIQVLFPLPEGTDFNLSAPIIDKATFEAFRSRPELHASLRSSFIRMLRFYGLLLTNKYGKLQVLPGRNFSPAYKNWVKRSDHNHLRITRIIRSLRVLGLEEEAEAFFAALTDIYTQQYPGRIGSGSMMFWTRAAKRPLYVAPQDDKDRGHGADFLYEYEKGQEESSKSDKDTSGNQEETGKKGEDVKSPPKGLCSPH